MTAVDRLQLGDHVCWGFDDDDARLDRLVRFVEAGCHPDVARMSALIGGRRAAGMTQPA